MVIKASSALGISPAWPMNSSSRAAAFAEAMPKIPIAPLSECGTLQPESLPVGDGRAHLQHQALGLSQENADDLLEVTLFAAHARQDGGFIDRHLPLFPRGTSFPTTAAVVVAGMGIAAAFLSSGTIPLTAVALDAKLAIACCSSRSWIGFET